MNVMHALPPALVPGNVVLLAVPGAVHNDFVTLAWTRNPLEALPVQREAGPASLKKVACWTPPTPRA